MCKLYEYTMYKLPYLLQNHHLSHILFVVTKCFEFGQILNVVVNKGLEKVKFYDGYKPANFEKIFKYKNILMHNNSVALQISCF